MESLNPSGTGKDRAVQSMLRMARQHPNFGPGVRLVEGTSGSTGIALAFQCNAMSTGGPHDSDRVQLHIVMPDDQAEEKRALLEKLGAQVVVTPCCAIANKDHYVNRARRLAQELDSEGRWEVDPLAAGIEEPTNNSSGSSACGSGSQQPKRRVNGAIFMDQFENEANFLAHYEGTGPEIWRQTGQQLERISGNKRLHAFVMSAGTGGTIAGVSK
jgi:cysteine synthase A